MTRRTPPRDVAVTGHQVPTLPGLLRLPSEPVGLVVFAHGSGSSRGSPRNNAVADWLEDAGLASLLFDLLTPHEAVDRSNVFDVALLAARLGAATTWVGQQPTLADLPVGFFGASTGAAAALWSAADLGDRIGAVVSRGGRPDLAAARLPTVVAPTLLVVGARDDVVIDLNRQAHDLLRCPRRLVLVPGATHLFEEPGTLEQAGALARDWFLQHLPIRV